MDTKTFIGLLCLFYILIPLWVSLIIHIFYHSQSRAMMSSVENMKKEGRIP